MLQHVIKQAADHTICAFGCLAVLALAVPAAAQLREKTTGSRLDQTALTMPLQQDDMGKVRTYFTNCLYQRSPERIDRILTQSDVRSFDYPAIGIKPQHFSSALGMNTCLELATERVDADLVMQTAPAALRAMMAEASYLAHNPNPPGWLDSIPALNRTYVSKDRDLAVAMALADFSDCVMMAAPRQADALLRTPSGSAAEKTAIRTLVPFVGPCVAAGQKVELNANTIRGYLADSLVTASQQARKTPGNTR